MNFFQINIPYIDPALSYAAREEALQSRYGFECDCSLCMFSRQHLQHLPVPPPRNSVEIQTMERELRKFVFGDGTNQIPTVPEIFERLPTTLYPLLHEIYLPTISEIFSNASHDGPYDQALSVGRTLLALYLVIYPPQYPQIGESPPPVLCSVISDSCARLTYH